MQVLESQGRAYKMRNKALFQQRQRHRGVTSSCIVMQDHDLAARRAKCSHFSLSIRQADTAVQWQGSLAAHHFAGLWLCDR